MAYDPLQQQPVTIPPMPVLPANYSTPQESADLNAPGAPGSGPITIRNLRNTKEECEFAARLMVEAFRGKYVHATSEGSLPNVISAHAMDFQIQNKVFYERNFVAEYNGQMAGLVALKFNGDPDFVSRDEHYRNLGCCDICGIVCMSMAADNERVPYGKCYVDHICVDDHFRGKGVGKILLQRADYEAKKRGCNAIYLWVYTGNRAMSLYKRQGYSVMETSRGCCCCLWCMLGISQVARMDKNL